MGRSMYKYGKQTKEKARQQKQLDKASKRLAAKHQKTDSETGELSTEAPIAEPVPGEESDNNPA